VNKNSAQQTASVLTEALPYIQKLNGKTVVIKFGGNAMVDEELQSSFARDIVLLKQLGVTLAANLLMAYGLLTRKP